MVAAVPYALASPVIERVVEGVNRSRAARGLEEPPSFDTPRPNARKFFAEAWRRGLDVKLGLAALVTQTLAMAPTTALAVVMLFFLFQRLFASDRIALGLALLYAFGTPAFFRTGFLSHNLMLGHIAFAGLLAAWNPAAKTSPGDPVRVFLAGLAGGACVLFDYGGVVFLGGLWVYAVFVRPGATSFGDRFRATVAYGFGALGPMLLLWFYQWRSFGHPFYPGQHWMPPVEWIELGYQGYGGPQLELLLALAFDYRFGLFASCPLFLLALAVPWLDRGPSRRLPAREAWTMLALVAALWIFFSGSNYTRLQWNTGIRYLAPAFPFLFVPAAVVLCRLPRAVVYFVVVLSVTLAWPMAMARDVARGAGVLNPLMRVLVEGFQLPSLSTLARMDGWSIGGVPIEQVSALPLFVLAAALLYGIWIPARSRTSAVPVREIAR